MFAYPFLLFFTSIIGVLLFRKISTVFKVVSLYILVTFLSETISLVLVYMLGNNSLVQKVYFPIEVLFLSTVYYLLFKDGKIKVLLLVCSSLLLCATAWFYMVRPQPLLPAYLISAESLILIVYSILYYYQVISYPDEGRLLASGVFWLNSSLLVYSSGSFVFWITFYYLYYHHIYFSALGSILSILNILQCLMIGASIYLDYLKARPKHTDAR